jgi:hypothetical protein
VASLDFSSVSPELEFRSARLRRRGRERPPAARVEERDAMRMHVRPEEVRADPTLLSVVRRLAAGIAIVALAQCGGSSTPPTSPTPAPTVQPTPNPTPSPTPTPGLPAGMTCSPTPPPLLRMHLKVHSSDGGRIVLDSKPLVPNIDHYCDRVGFGDWAFCETRAEGDPQRVACDYMATGKSTETGRWGPTWYYGSTLCSQSSACANHPTEQFMAIAKDTGTFKACAADDVPVASNGTRCGTLDLR